MTRRCFLARVLAIATVWLAGSVALPARADCSSAFEDTQRLRMASHLRDAQGQAVVCADASCPAWMQKECAAWLDELKRSTPSIVVRAIGQDGCDVQAADVFVDDVRVASRIDGHPIPLDPGPHRVLVNVGESRLEQQVVMAAGERERLVTARIAPAGVSCAASRPAAGRGVPQRPVPTLAMALGVLGVAALGTGAALEVSSLSQKSTFEQCAPHCDSDRVSAWETKWRIADVVVGVGLVSLAVAAYMYFTRPTETSSIAASSWGLRF
jgi:hypothetical protein